MHGAIRKRDIIAHPLITVQCFGWEVLLRSLLAGRDQTFLSIVGETEGSPDLAAALPELIGSAIKLELRAAELYRSLAQRFVDVIRVRDFFMDLARQEESHAELLQLCHAAAGSQGWAADYLEPWRKVVAHLKDEMPKLERRAEEVGGLEDALRLVIDVECSEVNEAFTAIVDATPSSFVRAVKAFSSAQQEHIELICRSIPVLAPDIAEACQVLREKYP